MLNRGIPSMRRYLTLIVLALLPIACGPPTDDPATVAATPGPPAPGAPERTVLVATTDGVAAVREGTATVMWSVDGGVAAVDGSRLMSRADDGTLRRHDPRTGRIVASWNPDPQLVPVLVEPGGTRVVLSDRPRNTNSWGATRTTTRLAVFDTATGNLGDVTVNADFEPEAFGTDPSTLFGLDYRGDHYRVQWLNIVSHERGDVSDLEKNPGEDMRGLPVHGVMSSDGSMLSTLYLNVGHHEPAFVHVLNLGGSSYCVDLPVAFANGAKQTIERTDEDLLVVRAPDIDQRAEFDLRTMDSEAGPEPVAVIPGAGPSPDAPYRRVPGFIALLGAARGDQS